MIKIVKVTKNKSPLQVIGHHPKGGVSTPRGSCVIQVLLPPEQSCFACLLVSVFLHIDSDLWTD